ncbi:MAG: hypothetical protein P4L46_01095, partial [Fimbriimonas sp.]|nr:hypothetical protein [Fimbriimonas sp.]
KRYETVAGNAWVVEKKWHDIHFLRCDFADVRYKSCVISNCARARRQRTSGGYVDGVASTLRTYGS